MKERKNRGSDVPNTFSASYYDYLYFADEVGKSFRRPNGSIEHWGYRNPQGEFLGAKDIAEAWREIFQPKRVLDIGGGRGTFITYLRDLGVEAYCMDFSRWAVQNPYVRCRRGWMQLADARLIPFKDNSFDTVLCLDTMEHIYEEDVDQVINEIYRVSSRYVFFQIAVVGGGSGYATHEEGYILKRGEPIPLELEGCAVAGHVTVQPSSFWEERLDREEWVIRRDMVHWFYSLVPEEVTVNWRQNLVVVMENIE